MDKKVYDCGVAKVFMPGRIWDRLRVFSESRGVAWDVLVCDFVLNGLAGKYDVVYPFWPCLRETVDSSMAVELEFSFDEDLWERVCLRAVEFDEGDVDGEELIRVYIDAGLRDAGGLGESKG